MAQYGGPEAMESDESTEGLNGAGAEPSEDHTFKADHHAKLAKLHHGIAKMHEIASAHHAKRAGAQEPDDGLDEDVVQSRPMPMSFGRGAR